MALTQQQQSIIKEFIAANDDYPENDPETAQAMAAGIESMAKRGVTITADTMSYVWYEMKKHGEVTGIVVENEEPTPQEFILGKEDSISLAEETPYGLKHEELSPKQLIGRVASVYSEGGKEGLDKWLKAHDASFAGVLDLVQNTNDGKARNFDTPSNYDFGRFRKENEDLGKLLQIAQDYQAAKPPSTTAEAAKQFDAANDKSTWSAPSEARKANRSVEALALAADRLSDRELEDELRRIGMEPPRNSLTY